MSSRNRGGTLGAQRTFPERGREADPQGSVFCNVGALDETYTRIDRGQTLRGHRRTNHRKQHHVHSGRGPPEIVISWMKPQHHIRRKMEDTMHNLPRYSSEDNPREHDRGKPAGKLDHTGLWNELDTRRVQLFVAFEQAARYRRAQHEKTWNLLREVYEEIEEALNSGELAKMERAKAAYDRLPGAAYRLVQPWAQRPEPTKEELFDARGDHGVLCFMEVRGGEYHRSYGPQLFEPQHLLAGELKHDLFAGVYTPVRVQIHELADKEVALDILREMVTFIELNWDEMAAGEFRYSQDCTWSPTMEEVDRIMAEPEDLPSGKGWSKE